MWDATPMLWWARTWERWDWWPPNHPQLRARLLPSARMSPAKFLNSSRPLPKSDIGVKPGLQNIPKGTWPHPSTARGWARWKENPCTWGMVMLATKIWANLNGLISEEGMSVVTTKLRVAFYCALSSREVLTLTPYYICCQEVEKVPGNAVA